MWKILFEVSHIKSFSDKTNLIRRFDMYKIRFILIFAPRPDKYSHMDNKYSASDFLFKK